MTRTRTSLSALQRPLHQWLLGLALVCAGFAASAQQGSQMSIGRLNLQQGTVSVSSAGNDRWSAARPGRQLAVGDRIWTDRNARAEVYIGPAALRLDGGTYVEFTGIDEDTIRINASRGNLQLSVRDMSPGQRISISIDTPNLSAAIGAPGEYRIATDAADTTTTWVAVASGHLTLHGQNGISQVLTERQQTTVSGRNLATVRTTRSQNSSFDTWVAERSRFDDQSEPARYGQPAVVVPPAALVARQQQIEYEQAQQQAQWMEQQRAAQAAQQQQQEWQREQDWRQQQEWRRQEDWRQQREWQQRRDWRERAEQDRWQQQQQQQQLQLQLQRQQQQALRQQQEMQQRAAQAQALQQQQLLQQQQAAQMQLQQQRAAQQQALAQQQMLRQQQELQQRAAQMQQQAQAQQQALQQAQLRALQQQRGIQPQPGQPAGDDPRRLWTSPDSR